MDENEIVSLREKYSQLSDEALIDMIRSGSNDYQPGVYDLLLTEARNRGIDDKQSLQQGIDKEKQTDAPSCGQVCQQEDELVEFSELLQIKSSSDMAFLESLLGQTDIAYYISGRDDFKMDSLTLMIDSSRLEEAKELLKSFTPGPLIESKDNGS